MFPFLARSYLATPWLLTIFIKFSSGKILLWYLFIFSWFVMNCLFQDQQVHFNKTMTSSSCRNFPPFSKILLGSPGQIEPDFGALCASFGQQKRIRFQVPKTWSPFCHGTADLILISVQSGVQFWCHFFFAAVKHISILFWVYRKIFYFRMYFVMNWF